MSDDNAKELIKRGEKCFSARENMLVLWQELAEQFYPERADYITERDQGDRFADHLYTTDPVMLRRELGDAFSWLRNENREWFKQTIPDDRFKKQRDVEAWFEAQTQVQRRVLYERQSRFKRAMKEGEHDFACIGNAVLSCEERDGGGLRFLDHHVRDCAWYDNAVGEADTLYRKFDMAARQMVQFFNRRDDYLHESVTRCLEQGQDKDKTFAIMHCMMPARDYEYRTKRRRPKDAAWVSVYLDVANQRCIREAPSFEFRYVVPRWATISGSVYGVSPAAMVALPEARMVQVLARIIQEAGEKSIDPPMLAHESGVRGEVNLQASGLTWISETYAEKATGEALRPLYLAKNPGLGVDLFLKSLQSLKEAWYVSKLSLPEHGTRTAYEVSQLIEEAIRANVPLFEPVETEFHLPVLDLSASILLRAGAFGTPQEMPDSLRRWLANGNEFTFEFSNPLKDAIERNKVMQYQGVMGLRSMALEQGVDLSHNYDDDAMARDATRGTGAPASWLRDEKEAAQIAEQKKQQQALQQTAAAIGGGAAVAEQIGKAGQSLGMIEGGRKAA